MNYQKYHLSARIIHWAMALIIISLLTVGFFMTYVLNSEDSYRMTIYGLHKSFGVLVMFLVIIRIFIRLSRPAPRLPSSIGVITKKLSLFVHFLLYVLMIFMPLSGYLMSNFFGYPVGFFGFNLPMLVERNIEWAQFFSGTHKFLGLCFATILLLHIAATLRHRFFDIPENNILKRMT
jgi:cytochrome b561